MFRRRSSHKPSEALLHAFRDRYSSAAAFEPGASPTATPFPAGPHHPAQDPRTVPDANVLLVDPEDEMENGQVVLGSYQRNHLNENHIFDLDPNSLEFIHGAGWAQSPHGMASMPDDMTVNTALAAASSALDTPTSLGFSERINAPQFPLQSPIAGHTAFNDYAMIQDMARAQGHLSSQSTHLSQSRSFDPQESLIHHQPSAELALDTHFAMQESRHYTQPDGDQTPQNLTRAEREQQQFRFRVKLMAPTAMIPHQDDDPITYLNKRQPYTITVVDTKPLQMPLQQTIYRTSIRVSFDDEPQRARPAASWQLFREGRGQSEADERGSPDLRAIEWVSLDQGGSTWSRNNVQKPHKECFDGFSVLWSPSNNMLGTAEASLQLRCNFLSTDFSHSKGVKGIPVRLCCKTEVIHPVGVDPNPEIAYCKVKTFRDHGAERKLNNDQAHVEKNIEKLVRELERNEAKNEFKDNGKRRRSDTNARGPPSKKFRTNSLSSGSPDVDDAEGQLEEKLRLLKAKMASGRDYSLLYLRGDDEDDPDSHPSDLLRETGMSTLQPQSLLHMQSSSSSSALQPSSRSPTSSSQSAVHDWRRDSSSGRGYLPTPVPGASRTQSSNDMSRMGGLEGAEEANPQHLASPPQGAFRMRKPSRQQPDSGQDWIDVVGHDRDYSPPVAQQRAVACFYVRPTVRGMTLGDSYFRALYLRDRTSQAFLDALCSKCGINADQVSDFVMIKSTGQHVKVDDDVIANMPEGSDMQGSFDVFDDSSTSAMHSESVYPDSYRLTLRP